MVEAVLLMFPVVFAFWRYGIVYRANAIGGRAEVCHSVRQCFTSSGAKPYNSDFHRVRFRGVEELACG